MSAELQEASALWKRARETLAVAEGLVAGGHPDDAASRAYYAAFHAASALLLCDGRKFSRHGGVLASVHRDYVRVGRLTPEAGERLGWLFALRRVADYGGLMRVAQAKAQRAVTDARAFVDEVQHLLPSDVAEQP